MSTITPSAASLSSTGTAAPTTTASPTATAAPTTPASATAGGPSVDGPRIVFLSKAETAENVEGGATAHFVFQVRNDGNRDLEITDVRPGCGCTVASFDHVISPGKTGVITADVHTGALWGPVVKTMAVYSNDPANPMDTLFLAVQVTPIYTVSPQGTVTVHYSDIAPITRTFDVTFHKAGVTLVNRPMADGPMTASITADPGQPDLYHVAVTLTPPSTGGDVLASIDFPTSLPQIPTVHLAIAALGDKGVSTSPMTASFGAIAHDFGQPVHCTVGVFSRGSAFHITGVETDDPHLKVHYMSQAMAISWYDVTLVYDGGWKAGKHEGFLTIHTDSPIAPVLQVPYWAMIL